MSDIQSTLTAAEVRRVAELSRLNFSDGEIEGLRSELAKCLDYIAVLDAVDTDGIEPTSHPIPLATAFRVDKVATTMTHDEALANAPETDGESFAVPRVV